MKKTIFYVLFFVLLNINNGLYSASADDSAKVMSIQEFEDSINSYPLFIERGDTSKDKPLDKYEIMMIESAQNEEGVSYGGKLDSGRYIGSFSGQTLVVGGGKDKGKYGENQGRTVLFDISSIESEITNLIANLESGRWHEDPHTGIKFKDEYSKKLYIDELKQKLALYREAFELKNNDILEQVYTVNIDAGVKPDLLGSINSVEDMEVIPDSKFTNIEFENVPCQVFLNSDLYKVLERIAKPGARISLTVTNACRRLMAPVIARTKFAAEFDERLREKYEVLERLHPTYQRLSFEIINY